MSAAPLQSGIPSEAVNWWRDELSINEQNSLMAAHLLSFERRHFGQYKAAQQAKMYAAHTASN